MKAKLLAGDEVVATGAKYLCIWCDTEFYFKNKTLICPTCGNKNTKDIVPIYMENDPQEEALYTSDDFIGG